jgi:hypothetical protein
MSQYNDVIVQDARVSRVPSMPPPAYPALIQLHVREVRVPGDFPEQAIGVGEVAGVAAPVGGRGGLDDPVAGGFDLRKQLIDFISGRDVMREDKWDK